MLHETFLGDMDTALSQPVSTARIIYVAYNEDYMVQL
jgi:hypothetical protein